MPYALSVHPALRVGVVRLTGAVTGNDLIAAAAGLAGRPDWQGDYRALWDAEDMAGLDFTFDDLITLVTQERALRARGEQGELVVVVQDSIWASLVKLFTLKMRAEARPLTILSTAEDAWRHLGVEDPPPAPDR